MILNKQNFNIFKAVVLKMQSEKRLSSNLASFRNILNDAKHVIVLSGAGVSAESGIPTFRGAGGLWRRYQAQNLATPGAFHSNPSLVWEFYHYRREVALSKEPNNAHKAIAECQERLAAEGRKLTIITQNIDGLHQRSGAKDVIELHGSLFKTRCTKCKVVKVNMDSPICPALKGKGAPDPEEKGANIPVNELPRCTENECNGLLRPHIVWFGENIQPDVLEMTETALEDCDLCLVVGTSSIVYPAALFAPQVARRGIPVAEFNLEHTPATYEFSFHFSGPCGTTLPEALKV